MMVLVSYNVRITSPGGLKRLRKFAEACTDYGQRVQHSVFECVVDLAQWKKLRNILEKIIDINTDSLRYYYLGVNYKHRVEHLGVKPSYDADGPIVI